MPSDIEKLLSGTSEAAGEQSGLSIQELFNEPAPLMGEVANVTPPEPPPAQEVQKGPVYPENWMPEEEKEFKTWYEGWADTAGIDKDPDSPLHFYDYRAAYRAGAFPTPQDDGLYHWPSEFKSDEHPNRYVDGMDTKYNLPVGAPPRSLDEPKPTYLTGGGMAETAGLADVARLMFENESPEVGKYLTAIMQGGGTSLTEIGAMAGGSMEYLGHSLGTNFKNVAPWMEAAIGSNPQLAVGYAIAKATGRVLDLIDSDAAAQIEKSGEELRTLWEEKGKEWFESDKEREGFEELLFDATKMIGPSVIPGGISRAGFGIVYGVGKKAQLAKKALESGNLFAAMVLKKEANDMAKHATNLASATSGLLFGLSQAGSTQRAGLKRAEELEAQGRTEDARKVREWAEGAAPLITGTIEGVVETIATKYLGKYLRLDQVGAPARGMKRLVVDFFKTLGVEIGTEVFQNTTEALTEHLTGITPVTQTPSKLLGYMGYDKPVNSILASALDVIGPTALFTTMFGAFGAAANLNRTPAKKEGEGDKTKVAPEETATESILKDMGAMPGVGAEETPDLVERDREIPEEGAEVPDFTSLKEAEQAGAKSTDEDVTGWQEARQQRLTEAEFFTGISDHPAAMRAIQQAKRFERAISAAEEPERFAEVAQPEAVSKIEASIEEFDKSTKGKPFDFEDPQDYKWLKSLGYSADEIYYASQMPGVHGRVKTRKLQEPSELPGTTPPVYAEKKEASIEPQGKPLSEITVKIPALRAATGERVMVPANAQETVTEIDNKISALEAIMGCLAS